MAKMNDSSAGGILMAFLLGAISGASVALLWAPSVGEETRRLVNERAREGKDRAMAAARQGQEFAQRKGKTIATAIDRGKEAYEQARERAKEKA